MGHFDGYASELQSWLINHLVGLLKWAEENKPDLLHKPHELLTFYFQNAVLPSIILEKATSDLFFVASCHRFLEENVDKIDMYPDIPKYRPKFGINVVSPAQKRYLQSLLAKLPEDHQAKTLDIHKLTRAQASLWIDRLKKEVSRLA